MSYKHRVFIHDFVGNISFYQRAFSGDRLEFLHDAARHSYDEVLWPKSSQRQLKLPTIKDKFPQRYFSAFLVTTLHATENNTIIIYWTVLASLSKHKIWYFYITEVP